MQCLSMPYHENDLIHIAGLFFVLSINDHIVYFYELQRKEKVCKSSLGGCAVILYI